MLNAYPAEEFQATIKRVLSPLVSTSKNILLLDFPDHSNVGDSAIWLGEIEYFYKYHGIRPDYVCTKTNCSFEKIARTPGIIFLHGGGNFGDVWPDYQKFRESIIARFPDRTIIQLPQTIHFSSQYTMGKTAEIINAHPNFTLLVRDNVSLAMARQAFTCKIELCPDMAYCLGTLRRPTLPCHEMLLLLRTDIEIPPTRDIPIALPHDTINADWLEEDNRAYQYARKMAIMQLPLLGIHAFNKNRRRELLYRIMAATRLQRGMAMLSSAKYVVTDRLHAHLLCCMMGIPNLPLDNNYGKIHNFIETWERNIPVSVSPATT